MWLLPRYSKRCKYLLLCPRCNDYTWVPVSIQHNVFNSTSPVAVFSRVFGSRITPDHKPRWFNEWPFLFANNRILRLNWWQSELRSITRRRTTHDIVPREVDQSRSPLVIRDSQDIWYTAMSERLHRTGYGLTDPPHLVFRRTTAYAHVFRLQGTVILWSAKVSYQYVLLVKSTE